MAKVFFLGKIAVTGGAGFIGSHLVQELVEKGHKVRVIDNLSFGKKANLTEFLDEIEFIEADIRNFEKLKDSFKNTDCVFHLAALRSVFPSFDNPREYADVNISGTLNVLKAAIEQNVKKVIFASSSSVYGMSEKFPQKETDVADPKSPYALTKYVGEYYMKHFFEQHGLETVSLRYFNVFGPKQGSDSNYAAVIPKFIKAVLQDEKPIIFGTGEQSRDFTFVKDVVLANISAMNAGKKAGGKVFNICNGKSVSINRLLGLVNKNLGKNILPVFAPSRESEAMKTEGSTKLAKEFLGFECKYSFEKGLEELINWSQINF